jgi:hypothetical protein
MLFACSSIIEQAIAHKEFLISKRANWADPFLPDLQSRIQKAFSNYLGIDNAKHMREATRIVTDIQTKALNDISEFKVQIQEDLKSDKEHLNETLNTLGFTTYYKSAIKKNQEALIQLLLQFKQNLTSKLQDEITKAGTPESLINTIIGYADTLKNANISQETLKGSKKEVSQTAVKEFNEIYNNVISVAKISSKFFKDNPAIKDTFSYTKTLKRLGQKGQKNTEIITICKYLNTKNIN